LPQDLRDKVCVIYFDNEEKGLLGSDFFRSKHKKEVKDKLLLNFDCVGDGREVVFLAKKKAREDENYNLLLGVLQECAKYHDVDFLCGNIKPMMFGSDQMHFEKGVGVCALRKSPFGRYVARIHTPFDTICREENIMYLVDGIQRYLEYNYR
jgi:Zn-dependent M28 family amino/carboxypeptidase